MRKKSKAETAKQLKQMAGRRDWNGIKPVERVIPNKKKDQSFRKAKHKNRRHDGGSYFGGTQQGAAGQSRTLPVVFHGDKIIKEAA